MGKISEQAAPAALTGLELFPGLQAGGNVGIPLAAMGALPKGAIVAMRVPYVIDTGSTADSDPGTALLKWNNATQPSATFIYLDDVDDNAVDRDAVWSTINAGGFLYVQGVADRSVWQKWQIAAVTNATGYAKFGITLDSSNGTFADGDVVEVTIQQPSPSPGIDRSTVTALSIASGVVTVDCSLGDYFTLTMSANVTSLVFTNLPAAGYAASLAILITQGAGTAYTLAFPSSATFRWGSDGAQTISATLSSKNLLALSMIDGAKWDATLSKDRA